MRGAAQQVSDHRVLLYTLILRRPLTLIHSDVAADIDSSECTMMQPKLLPAVAALRYVRVSD